MTMSTILTIAVFLFVVISFIWQKISSTLTITIAVAILWAAGILTTQDVFANFTGMAIVILVSMMMVSGGLMKTNILNHIVNLVMKFDNGGEKVLVFAALVITFILANFMNGVVALICLMPLLMGLAEKANVSKSRLIEVANTGALLE